MNNFVTFFLEQKKVTKLYILLVSIQLLKLLFIYNQLYNLDDITLIIYS
jgi:hypothetical protein